MHATCRWLAILWTLLAVAGCAPTGVVRVDIPEGYAGELAGIRSGGTPNFFSFLGGGAAHCFIGSIDNRTGADEFLVVPGTHKFQLYVTHMGLEFLGPVDMAVPNARDLTLIAKRDGSRFELMWVRTGTSDVVAASGVDANRFVPLYVPATSGRK